MSTVRGLTRRINLTQQSNNNATFQYNHFTNRPIQPTQYEMGATSHDEIQHHQTMTLCNKNMHN